MSFTSVSAGRVVGGASAICVLMLLAGGLPGARSYAALRAEAQPPVDDVPGHVVQRPAVAERVGAQPHEGLSHGHSELNGNHARRLMHDVLEVGVRLDF